jgi:ABC-type uncharacterized transport system ATPase subunit
MTTIAPEYGAVRHILTSPSIKARTAPHIAEDDFNWTAILAEAASMSGGEQILVRTAYDLWEAAGKVGILEIARGLDQRSFERVVHAIALARGESPARANLLQAA